MKLGFPDNCAWSATQRGAAIIVVVVIVVVVTAVETSESFRFGVWENDCSVWGINELVVPQDALLIVREPCDNN